MHDRIRAVLATYGRMPADPQGIAADADLYDLGLSSHASVNVMLALEDEFDIEFPDDALNKTTFATIISIERAVCELTAAAA
jgi:acyl carrier protein